MAKDQGVRDKFLELRASGLSLQKISDKIGVSKTTLVKWNKQYKAELTQLADEELEELMSKLRVSLKARVERLALHLMVIEEVLQKRDMSDVPTSVLLREFRLLLEALREELLPMQQEQEQDPYLSIVSRCMSVVTENQETVLRLGDIAAEVAQSLTKS